MGGSVKEVMLCLRSPLASVSYLEASRLSFLFFDSLKARNRFIAHTRQRRARAIVAAVYCQHYLFNTTKWEIPEEEKVLQEIRNDAKATYYPKGELVYFGGKTELIPANLRLAYKFNIYAHDPGSRDLIFVDAVNGNILDSENLLHTIDAVGTATTVYSGTQSITTDNNATNLFILKETGRGQGIQVLNARGITNVSNLRLASNFNDTDNKWNNVNAN